ncbi:MAG: hypothetical protein NZ951_04840 [Dehalococcoidia bacterium]|nr:hypothetical protein [Dehalococcoidia bacterium]MDW8120153.1 prefoldin domain-containing protein [Chloroflexota bacterium]
MRYRFRRFAFGFPLGPFGFGLYFGARRWFGPPFRPYRREDYRRWLEEYQRDLQDYRQSLQEELQEVEAELREVAEELQRLGREPS